MESVSTGVDSVGEWVSSLGVGEGRDDRSSNAGSHLSYNRVGQVAPSRAKSGVVASEIQTDS